MTKIPVLIIDKLEVRKRELFLNVFTCQLSHARYGLDSFYDCFPASDGQTKLMTPCTASCDSAGRWGSAGAMLLLPWLPMLFRISLVRL